MTVGGIRFILSLTRAGHVERKGRKEGTYSKQYGASHGKAGSVADCPSRPGNKLPIVAAQSFYLSRDLGVRHPCDARHPRHATCPSYPSISTFPPPPRLMSPTTSEKDPANKRQVGSIGHFRGFVGLSSDVL
ncbi:hypothetical protein KM043_015549 [Ampulex compressa]|nr:hypothetical protein KM043_015549 [Ampulex compressa]